MPDTEKLFWEATKSETQTAGFIQGLPSDGLFYVHLLSIKAVVFSLSCIVLCKSWCLLCLLHFRECPEVVPLLLVPVVYQVYRLWVEPGQGNLGYFSQVGGPPQKPELLGAGLEHAVSWSGSSFAL